MQVKIAYQLYSARAEAQKDFKSTLKTVKAIGYDAVEFAGFFGFSSAKILSFLNEAGLEAASSHVPLKELKENLKHIIQFHKEIGCNRIVVPYLEEKDRAPREEFEEFIDLLKTLEHRLSKEGMELYYHNHDFEFVPYKGGFALDYMYNEVPGLKSELDSCWIKFAGQNPVEYLSRYKGRYELVHLKDFICDRFDGSPYQLLNAEENNESTSNGFKFMPFGYGIQPCRALIEAAVANGAKFLIIEQDEAYDIPSLKAAEISYGTVRDILCQL